MAAEVSTLMIERAAAADARRVLRMALADGRRTAASLEAHVTGFLAYAQEMGLDLSRQWLATRDGRMMGGCLWIESPGRTALLLLPNSATMPGGTTVTAALVHRALSEAAGSAITMAQCLIDPADARSRAVLSEAGFEEIAVLIYLECVVGDAATCGHPQEDEAMEQRTSWQQYDAASHGAFAELVMETYEGSQDCPKLSGLREIDDILAGHRAAGRFDPRRWLLARLDGRAAGCILLSENPLRPALEVTYMGVAPHARGQGIGRLLLRRALAEAYLSGFQRLTLAVDSENAPALRLYRSFGFFETARQRAMIRRMKDRGHAFSSLRHD